MLNRLLASRWLRPGLLVLSVGFCGYGLFIEWPQVRTALGLVPWYSVALAAIAAAAGSACMMLAWRALVADLGTRLPVPAAARVQFISQIAKYLPGTVWAFAAQVELGRDYQVPRRRGATAVVVSLALTLAVALAAAAVLLPLSSAGAARRYWWALALAPVILACLWPPVLGRALDLVLRLAGRQPLEQRPSARGMSRVLAWTLLGWLLWGLQAWLLVRDLTGPGTRALPVAIGGYALAWSVGILLVIFPGGVGPRELALIAVLAPVMPRGSALTVALISRAVMTATDVGWGAAGVALGRWAPRTAPEPTPTSPRRGKHRKRPLPVAAREYSRSNP